MNWEAVFNRYRKTSNKNGGQYSGPCIFTGEGKDRFTIEPFNDTGKVRWFCRACRSDCQHGFSSPGGRYRYGTLGGEEANMPGAWHRSKGTVERRQFVEDAIRYHNQITQRTESYLYNRGLSTDVVDKFMLGTSDDMKGVTIPAMYTWRGKKVCNGIKVRYIGKPPNGMSKYRALPGSNTKAIFNFDVLRNRECKVGFIANSLFDIMLLDDLGFPVIGPFAGEAWWSENLVKYIHWDIIINIADNDPPNKRGVRPGEMYALRRAMMLIGKRVANVSPPEEFSDVSDMGLERAKEWAGRIWTEQKKLLAAG